MTGWTRSWRHWPQALRARYALAVTRPAGVGMALLNRREPLVRIRPQVTIQASWNVTATLQRIEQSHPRHAAMQLRETREVGREVISTLHTPAPARPGENGPQQTPLREVVREVGSAPMPNEPPVRSISTLSVLHRHSTIDEQSQRRRRLTLTTDVARSLRERLRVSAARVETPRLEPVRLVEAMPAPRPSAAVATRETDTPSRVTQRTPVLPQQPQLDVDSITNHVIQQLDHRLIAFRERMGRV